MVFNEKDKQFLKKHEQIVLILQEIETNDLDKKFQMSIKCLIDAENILSLKIRPNNLNENLHDIDYIIINDKLYFKKE